MTHELALGPTLRHDRVTARSARQRQAEASHRSRGRVCLFTQSASPNCAKDVAADVRPRESYLTEMLAVVEPEFTNHPLTAARAYHASGGPQWLSWLLAMRALRSAVAAVDDGQMPRSRSFWSKPDQSG